MDYLLYVEHNAESLQFFLWYCDYIQRWSRLLPRQKALSPVWHSDKAQEPQSRYITYSHKRARSEKMNKILSIMEAQTKDVVEEDSHPIVSTPSTSSTNYSKPRISTASSAASFYPPSSLSSPIDARDDWQPCKYTPVALIGKQL